MHGMEFETNGRIAPAIRSERVKPGEKARNVQDCQIEAPKVIKKCGNLIPGGRSALRSASSPTGC